MTLFILDDIRIFYRIIEYRLDLTPQRDEVLENFVVSILAGFADLFNETFFFEFV